MEQNTDELRRAWHILSPMSRRYQSIVIKVWWCFVAFTNKSLIQRNSTTTPACRRFLHRPNQNKEVAQSCTCRYGDAMAFIIGVQ